MQCKGIKHEYMRDRGVPPAAWQGPGKANPEPKDTALRAHRKQSTRAALQTDRGRLRYIDDFACAQTPRVLDGVETLSTISLKQASTIVEIRSRAC
jgi:hypothetical protein